MVPFFLTTLLAASFLEMSPQEQKDTGIYKLSDKEKEKLQEWVKNNSSRFSKPAAAPTLPKQKNPTLSENLNNGNYLKLSDGSVWNIRAQDTPISQGWISEVEVIIAPSSDPMYPYKLTNSVSKSSILAKKVSAVPSATPQTSPTPTTPTTTPKTTPPSKPVKK